MKRRIWVLMLCICMLLSCLTACGSSQDATDAWKENESGSDRNETEPSASVGGANAAAVPDYAAIYRSLQPDTVVMTVNGEAVLWQEYYRWLYYIMTHLQETAAVTDWDAPCAADPDCTNAEYAMFYAQSAVTQYHVIAQTAAARNVVLNAEEEAQLQQQWDAHAAHFTAESELLARLAEVYSNQAQYRFERETALLYEKLFAVCYGEHGEKCSNAQVAAFAENNAYVRMRYLLLLTVDEDRMLLDETAIAAQKDRITVLYQQILDAQDSAAEFERLYAECNEDAMAELYPDGYLCSLDRIPNVELRDAIAAMPEYGIGEPVKGRYGYYILYRLPLDYDGIAEYDKDSEIAYTLRHLAAIDAFHNEVAALFAEANVVCSEPLTSLQLHQHFGLW